MIPMIIRCQRCGRLLSAPEEKPPSEQTLSCARCGTAYVVVTREVK